MPTIHHFLREMPCGAPVDDAAAAAVVEADAIGADTASDAAIAALKSAACSYDDDAAAVDDDVKPGRSVLPVSRAFRRLLACLSVRYAWSGAAEMPR